LLFSSTATLACPPWRGCARPHPRYMTVKHAYPCSIGATPRLIDPIKSSRSSCRNTIVRLSPFTRVRVKDATGGPHGQSSKRKNRSNHRRQPGHRSGHRSAFAEEGADISFCYRSNKASADEVAANIQKTGRKVAGLQYDVSSVSDGQKFVADTAAQFGKIDVLVNNAGLERRANFREVPNRTSTR
jgi:short chain dehydrogenase